MSFYDIETKRLRNAYKPQNKIANAVAHTPKILLTATPLQNSLLELYGLVSVIDDYRLEEVVVGFEATVPYAEPLVQWHINYET